MIPINPLDVIIWSLMGSALGLILSWMPGFHIVNIMVLITLVYPGLFVGNEYYVPYFALGAVIAFSFMSSISTVYLSVADDSMMLMLFPTQRYLLMGYGHRAVLLYLIGALTAIIFLAIFSLTIATIVMPIVYNLFSPYYLWILLGIVLFLFLSEWPKEGERGETGGKRLFLAWRQIIGGVIVFFASGILGLYVNYSSLIPVERAFARLTPLFIGFFGLSWILRNLLSRVIIPKQITDDVVETHVNAILAGAGSGIIGGGIAAFFPVVTGGMGALIGGHMASTRGDDTFIISQGAARTIYYVGALLLLFNPVSRITRGAVAWLVSGLYSPKTWTEYYYAIFVLVFIGALSFIVTLFMSRLVSKLLSRVNYIHLSIAVAVFLFILTYLVAGLWGIPLMLVATAVGFTALVFNTRLSYCLGALILPVLLSMTCTLNYVLPILGIRW